jgi:hypothetical protein
VLTLKDIEVDQNGDVIELTIKKSNYESKILRRSALDGWIYYQGSIGYNGAYFADCYGTSLHGAIVDFLQALQYFGDFDADTK